MESIALRWAELVQPVHFNTAMTKRLRCPQDSDDIRFYPATGLVRCVHKSKPELTLYVPIANVAGFVELPVEKEAEPTKRGPGRPKKDAA